LSRALADEPHLEAPDVFDGLAEARWWFGDVARALAARVLPSSPVRSPVAKLAELLVLQGRVEEVADVVGDDESDGTLWRGRALGTRERALDRYAGLHGLLDVARALRGAESTKNERPEVARVEAAAAFAGFEAALSSRMADGAHVLLRELGDRLHVGREGAGLLTDPALEILRLVARGLTNAEIAERLFISTKTAWNHVGNIFAKIGARRRQPSPRCIPKLTPPTDLDAGPRNGIVPHAPGGAAVAPLRVWLLSSLARTLHNLPVFRRDDDHAPTPRTRGNHQGVGF